MYGIKVLLRTAAFCSALLAVLMLWNIEALSCGVTTAKVFITMFIILAIVLTKEVATIKTGYEKQVGARASGGDSQLGGNPIGQGGCGEGIFEASLGLRILFVVVLGGAFSAILCANDCILM